MIVEDHIIETDQPHTWVRMLFWKSGNFAQADAIKMAIIELSCREENIGMLTGTKNKFHVNEFKADKRDGVIVLYSLSLSDVWRQYGKECLRYVLRNHKYYSEKFIDATYDSLSSEIFADSETPDCDFNFIDDAYDYFDGYDWSFLKPKAYPTIENDHVDDFIELEVTMKAILKRSIQSEYRTIRIESRMTEYHIEEFKKCADEYKDKPYIVLPYLVYLDYNVREKYSDIIRSKKFFIEDGINSRHIGSSVGYNYRVTLSTYFANGRFPLDVYYEYTSLEENSGKVGGVDIFIPTPVVKSVKSGQSDYIIAFFTKTAEDGIKVTQYIIDKYLSV